MSGVCLPHKIGILVQPPLAAEVIDYAAIYHEGEIGAINIFQNFQFHIGAFSTDGRVDVIDLLFTSLVNVWISTPWLQNAARAHQRRHWPVLCATSWQWQLAEARAGRLGLAQRLAKWHQSSVSWCRPSAGVEARQQRLALARGGSVVLAHSIAQVLLGAR